jgi:hypothetical protein
MPYPQDSEILMVLYVYFFRIEEDSLLSVLADLYKLAPSLLSARLETAGCICSREFFSTMIPGLWWPGSDPEVGVVECLKRIGTTGVGAATDVLRIASEIGGSTRGDEQEARGGVSDKSERRSPHETACVGGIASAPVVVENGSAK